MLHHRLAALKKNLQGPLFLPQAFPDKLTTAYPGDFEGYMKLTKWIESGGPAAIEIKSR